MGSGRKFNKKPVSRPRKSMSEKAKRQRVQKARLIGLGVAPEVADKLQPLEIRTMLKRPKKVQAGLAKA